MTFTKEVLPAFCSPINESSISFLKKRLGVGSGCVELRQRVGSGDECAGTGETRGLAGEGSGGVVDARTENPAGGRGLLSRS